MLLWSVPSGSARRDKSVEESTELRWLCKKPVVTETFRSTGLKNSWEIWKILTHKKPSVALPALTWTSKDKTRPAELLAPHRYVALCTSGLKWSSRNAGKTRLPLAITTRAPGTGTTGEPSLPNTHSTRGSGEPSAAQSNLPPLEFENTNCDGGSRVKRGPRTSAR